MFLNLYLYCRQRTYYIVRYTVRIGTEEIIFIYMRIAFLFYIFKVAIYLLKSKRACKIAFATPQIRMHTILTSHHTPKRGYAYYGYYVRLVQHLTTVTAQHPLVCVYTLSHTHTEMMLNTPRHNIKIF